MNAIRTMALLAVSLIALSFSSVAYADPPRATTTASPTEAPSSEGVVNINQATAEELERLPSIGPARAQAILQLRERVHHFAHVEDLLRVRGIGRVGLRRMRPFVALTGDTTLAARPGHAPPVNP